MRARDEDSVIEGVSLLKAIDNSQVVREVDPRASRDIWLLLGLVAVLVAGLVLYAWPNLELRRTDARREEMSRERDRLIEANRKLRLEKASLEDLRRIESIASKELGLAAPPPARLVVVERPLAPAPGAVLARSEPEERR